MKKIKHSKFKNTGFIFELLVRQVTSEILSSNKSVAEKILKEFFNSKKELSKELKLYQYLINEKYNSEVKAEKFIDTVCEARKRLDEVKITKEKYNLIKTIKENYDKDNNLTRKLIISDKLVETYKKKLLEEGLPQEYIDELITSNPLSVQGLEFSEVYIDIIPYDQSSFWKS